jgi:hypothetical protein
MSLAIRASRARISSGTASTSESTVSFNVSTVQPTLHYTKKDIQGKRLNARDSIDARRLGAGGGGRTLIPSEGCGILSRTRRRRLAKEKKSALLLAVQPATRRNDFLCGRLATACRDSAQITAMPEVIPADRIHAILLPGCRQSRRYRTWLFQHSGWGLGVWDIEASWG